MTATVNIQEGRRDAKRRKTAHACDHCRLKKSHGHVAGRPQCSNCIQHREECTYDGVMKTCQPSKEYVEFLEGRVKLLESAVKKPSIDDEPGCGNRNQLPASRRTSTSSRLKQRSDSPPKESSASPAPAFFNERNLTTEIDEGRSSGDDELKDMYMAFKHLDLNPPVHRYFGKTANARLIQAAISLKGDLHSGNRPSLASIVTGMQSKRPDLWDTQPWERMEFDYMVPITQLHHFPEPDLMLSLVDIYFLQLNSLYPVLHRPSFMRSLMAHEYLHDHGFARLLLLVCSIGARFSDDHRIFVEGEFRFSAGWKWFNQVSLNRKPMRTVRLCDIQLHALAGMFTWIASTPQVSWLVVETGLRYAQELGAHRRAIYAQESNMNDELWKRTFWVLVILDRIASLHLGRPCAIQDEDLDIFPIPEEEKRQSGKLPSTMEVFVQNIQLSRILAFALSTLYSVNKSHLMTRVMGPDWEQQTVLELSSALKRWLDALPDHLRWDDECADALLFHQSTVLHLSYHQVQLAIHRPFIHDPTCPNSTKSSALSKCTITARSFSQLMATHLTRLGAILPVHMHELVPAALVLILSTGGAASRDTTGNYDRTVEEVHQCMGYLMHHTPRWQRAGRAWQTLHEVVTAIEFPDPVIPTPSVEHTGNPKFQVTSGPSTALVHWDLHQHNRQVPHLNLGAPTFATLASCNELAVDRIFGTLFDESSSISTPWSVNDYFNGDSCRGFDSFHPLTSLSECL